MRLLVIGSQGLLGRHVVEHWRRASLPVLTASHRPGAELRLDLAAPLREWPTLPWTDSALVCGGITSLDACAQDPSGTARLNVAATTELLSRLLEQGTFPVFCSSDLVFRGDRGNYTEEDAPDPTTVYGRHKLAVEDWLAATGQPHLVIRMSKLYALATDDPSPVGGMLRTLARGEAIRAAVDQVVCPTWAGDVAATLERLLASGATGCFHVASPTRYTRHTLALRLARWLGREELVWPCRISELLFDEPRPTDNSLVVDKVRAATGRAFRELSLADVRHFVPDDHISRAAGAGAK